MKQIKRITKLIEVYRADYEAYTKQIAKLVSKAQHTLQLQRDAEKLLEQLYIERTYKKWQASEMQLHVLRNTPITFDRIKSIARTANSEIVPRNIFRALLRHHAIARAEEEDTPHWMLDVYHLTEWGRRKLAESSHDKPDSL